ERNGFEAMRNELSIPMHRERRRERRPAVRRTQHANLAGERLCKRLRVGDDDPSLRPERDLRPILALGRDDIILRIDDTRGAPARAFVSTLLHEELSPFIQPDDP